MYYLSVCQLLISSPSDNMYISTVCSEVSVVCGVSSVLVRGVLQRWTPVLLEAQRNPPETPSGKKQDKGKSKTPASLLGMVDPSADEDFKGALKV